MITAENKIFTLLATTLRTNYTGINVVGEYTPTPSKFPCVFIEEKDNYTGIFDGSGNEKTSNLTYEINVFSNLASGRKTQCKNIMNTIDGKMIEAGFRRLSLMPIPNEDSTIYRMVARYVGSIDSNSMIYRR